MSPALVLACLVLSGAVNGSSHVCILIMMSLFNGIVVAIEAPSHQAFYSKLVPKKNLANAIALNFVTINGSRITCPTIGGVLIALEGVLLPYKWN